MPTATRVAADRRRWTSARRLLGQRFAPLRDLRRVRLLDLEDLEGADRWSSDARPGRGNQPHVAYTIVPPLAGLRRRGSTVTGRNVLRDDGERQMDFAPGHKGSWAFVAWGSIPGRPCPCPRREHDVHEDSETGAWVSTRLPADVDNPVMRWTQRPGASSSYISSGIATVSPRACSRSRLHDAKK